MRTWTLFICSHGSMFVDGDQRSAKCHRCKEAVLAVPKSELSKREREVYESIVKLADQSSDKQAIDYLRKVIAQPIQEET